MASDCQSVGDFGGFSCCCTQMLGTLTPIVVFPHEVCVRVPYAPTLEGQYIIKTLVLISAGTVIGATVRGGALAPVPPTPVR